MAEFLKEYSMSVDRALARPDFQATVERILSLLDGVHCRDGSVQFSAPQCDSLLWRIFVRTYVRVN